jgi:alanine-glyoxylate transaminase/(R)-3-amino-2-methylpropionate-pyruvate transaminase
MGSTNFTYLYFQGIGNGFPLAAVVTTREIGATMARANHFNTYGGNPLASAVGMAVLDVIEEDGCQQTASKVGTYMLKSLEEIRNEFEVK